MKWIVLSSLAVLFLLGHVAFAGRVLAVFPIAAKSHWSFCSSILKVLNEGGHEITVITPFTCPNSPDTFKCIYLPGFHETLSNLTSKLKISKGLMTNPLFSLYRSTLLGPKIVPLVMETPEFQDILRDQSTHFDLVLIEPYGTDALYGLGEYLQAPIVTAFPSAPTRMINDVVSNPADPAHVPNLFLPFTKKMTLIQRLQNYIMAFLEFCLREVVAIPVQVKLYQKYFPNNTKSLKEVINKDVALAFVNTHVSLSFPRAYVPNMIEIGGINIDRRQGVLPKDFQEFLDSANDEGVILFSMGSILQASHFSAPQLDALISAFGQLKQKVIWRYNLNATARELPENILTRDWLPQKEILAHRNLKIFITHGGMLGTTESVYHGKPMIGIPVYGDQYLNIASAVNQGYALQLDMDNLTDIGVVAAVKEILGNESYSKRAQELSRIFRDQPMTPQESVLYWCEFVMRHKGARHLRVEKLGFLAENGLDVMVVMLGVLGLAYLVMRWMIRKAFRIRSKETEKMKKL